MKHGENICQKCTIRVSCDRGDKSCPKSLVRGTPFIFHVDGAPLTSNFGHTLFPPSHRNGCGAPYKSFQFKFMTPLREKQWVHLFEVIWAILYDAHHISCDSGHKLWPKSLVRGASFVFHVDVPSLQVILAILHSCPRME